MRALIPPAFVLIGLSAVLSGESSEGPGLEPWLFNPRERTAKALQLLEQGRSLESLEAAEAARRLAPEEATTHFNAGTLRLLLGAPGAAEALEEAAGRAEGGLLPLAHFNLGNVHLAASRPAAAVEAYKTTLRHDPDHQAAKFNLELALQELESPPAPSPEVPSPAAPPEGEGGDGLPDGEPDPDADGTGEPQLGEDDEAWRDFLDQPELSAEQAAAILDAVERLERQQREQEAGDERRTATGGKDW